MLAWLLFAGRVDLFIETSGGAERWFLFLIFGLLAGIHWDVRLAGGSVPFLVSLLGLVMSRVCLAALPIAAFHRLRNRQCVSYSEKHEFLESMKKICDLKRALFKIVLPCIFWFLRRRRIIQSPMANSQWICICCHDVVVVFGLLYEWKVRWARCEGMVYVLAMALILGIYASVGIHVWRQNVVMPKRCLRFIADHRF